MYPSIRIGSYQTIHQQNVVRWWCTHVLELSIGLGHIRPHVNKCSSLMLYPCIGIRNWIGSNEIFHRLKMIKEFCSFFEMGHHIGSNQTWNWQNDHQWWWCTHALELGIGLGGVRRFKNKLNLSIFWMSRNQKVSKCCHASLGLIKNKISNSNTNTQLTTTPHHGEISCTNWAPNCPAVD